MKRVKIMLTAITVLAVVGGALAFKAKSTYNAVIYTGPACDQQIVGFTLDTPSESGIFAGTVLNDPNCAKFLTVEQE